MAVATKPSTARSQCTIVVIVLTLLVACAAPPRDDPVLAPPVTVPAVPAPPAPPEVVPPVPAALADAGLDLRAGATAVPLELLLPSLGVHAPVVGVGITAEDVMDAPVGPPGDPVWQQAFWYRGSAVPGERSTALIAGHISGSNRPAIFARLDELGLGEPIVVRDTRTGLDVRFSVTESVTYSLQAAAEPAVLARIYGTGPVAGTPPQPSADGLSHLTLITCTGTFKDGTHDHRRVVYATRS